MVWHGTVWYGMVWHEARPEGPIGPEGPSASCHTMPYHTMTCHTIPVLSYTYTIALLSYYILSSCYIIIWFILHYVLCKNETQINSRRGTVKKNKKTPSEQPFVDRAPSGIYLGLMFAQHIIQYKSYNNITRW